MTKNMMKFQNSEGFHHVPDQCCHFPPKPTCFIMLFQTLPYLSECCHSFPLSPCIFRTFHRAFSQPFRIFLNPAIPSPFHHAFATHFTMIRPTLPFFTKAVMEKPPYDPLWQPFLVCFSTSISNHPRLRAIPETNQIFFIILLSMKQSGNPPPQAPETSGVQAPEVKPLEYNVELKVIYIKLYMNIY